MKHLSFINCHLSFWPKAAKTLMLLATALVTTISLSSCEDEDDYIAQQLRDRDWQGYVGTYYSSRWGLSGNEFATVMRFWSRGSYYTSGKGEELDYDTRSRFNDYAYCTFRWFIVDGDITLIYDDDKWTPLYIIDYHLSSNRFWGYIRDYNNSRLKFDLTSDYTDGGWAYDDWDDYKGRKPGGYGDFSNQNWYRSRMLPAEGEWRAVPAGSNFVDRTDIARQQSGDPTAVSLASGSFADAISR